MQGDGFLVKELRLGRQDRVMQLFKEDPRDDKRKSHCEGEKDGSAEKKKQIFVLLKVRRKKKSFLSAYGLLLQSVHLVTMICSNCYIFFFCDCPIAISY